MKRFKSKHTITNFTVHCTRAFNKTSSRIMNNAIQNVRSISTERQLQATANIKG